MSCIVEGAIRTIHYPRKKLIPVKCPTLSKTQPKLFQICAKWYNTQKTIFKLNFVKKIVSLCKNYKETSSKNEQCLKIFVFVIVICVINLIFSESKKRF